LPLGLEVAAKKMHYIAPSHSFECDVFTVYSYLTCFQEGY
jgi:hypothetical protein